VRRIEQYRLSETISHHTVILSQLAAPGVAAHEVRKRTGMQVVYGPVRAEDIGAFVAAGMQATREMRRVRFPLRDRVALIPVELVTLAKWPLLLAALLMILAGLARTATRWIASPQSASLRQPWFCLPAWAAWSWGRCSCRGFQADHFR